MAKVLKEFTFGERAAKASKYPWAEWMDGKIRMLEGGEGKDFQSKCAAILAQARSKAKKAGMALRASHKKDSNTVVIQFYTPPVEQTAEAPAAETKAKKK